MRVTYLLLPHHVLWSSSILAMADTQQIYDEYKNEIHYLQICLEIYQGLIF
jgi:hypothetical protein